MSKHTAGKAIIQHFEDSPQLCIEVPYWERATEATSHPTFIATIYGPHPEEDAQRIAVAVNSHDGLLAALEKLDPQGAAYWLPIHQHPFHSHEDSCPWCPRATAIDKAKLPA